MSRIFGTIEIIGSHGDCVSIQHELTSVDDNSITIHAETIVKALGDDWMIHLNTGDGLIKIGEKKPQTDKAKLRLGLEVPKTPTMSDAWLTTVEIEEEYGLAKGSVRRDIYRKKFSEDELKKVGRDWTVRMDAANRLYDKNATK